MAILSKVAELNLVPLFTIMTHDKSSLLHLLLGKKEVILLCMLHPAAVIIISKFTLQFECWSVD